MAARGEFARGALVVALLLACGGMSRAEDENQAEASLNDAVEAVIAAHDAQSKSAVKALAAADFPDPWEVADQLLRAGQAEAAKAFAAAAPRAETKRLPRYVRRWRPEAKGVVSARDALATALRERSAGRPDAAEAAIAEAAKCAKAIGWLTLASEALYQFGLVHWDRGELREAESRFREHLGLEQELGSEMGRGRGHYRVASALHARGETEAARGEDLEARALLEASGDAYYLAKDLSNEGTDRARGGDPVGGRDIFVKVAALLTEIDYAAVPHRFRPSEDAVGMSRVTALTNAASMSARIGEDDVARDYAREAVSVAKAVDSPRVLLEARATLARIEAVRHQVAGRMFDASAELERSRALYAKLGRRDEMADVIRRQAIVRAALADLPTALTLAEEAIDILIETGARRELINAYLAASTLCVHMGRLSEALASATEAVRLARLLQEDPLLADALTSVASVEWHRLEYGRSFERLEEAMRVHEANPGTDATGTMMQLARYYNDVNDAPRALEIVDKVVKLRASGPLDKERSDPRTFRARLLYRTGKTDEAVDELVDALERVRAGGDRRQQASLSSLLGHVVFWRRGPGDLEHAAELFDRAIGLASALRDRDAEVHARIQRGRVSIYSEDPESAHEMLATADEQAEEHGQIKLRAYSLAALAESHYHAGRYKEAMAKAMQGTELVSGFGLDMEEDGRSFARARFAPLPRWGIASAAQLGDAPTLYEFIERGRATALVASLGGRSALREAQVSKPLRAAEDRARAEAALALARYREAKRAGKRTLIKQRQRELEAARAGERAAVDDIQASVRSQVDLAYPSPAPFSELLASIAADEAIVLYAWTGWEMVAEVITRNRAWIAKLEKGARLAAFDLRQDPADPKHVLAARKALIDPLKLPAGVKRLIVSPSASTTWAPLAMLVPDLEVCLIPSATAYLALRSRGPATGSDVLSLGDPAYRTVRRSGQPALRGEPAPLPGTREEAKAVGDVVLLGEDASETKFREVVSSKPHWRAVHFACHGHVDAMFATNCALVLVQDDENDGLLRANELFDVDGLSISADLVVLSGCETAGGRIISGEGLQGLSRALMLGGTPRVIASLWKVDDAATSALMIKFYELWNPKSDSAKRISAAAALRDAQAYVRSQRKWQDPKYWAGWVLWGLPE